MEMMTIRTCPYYDLEYCEYHDNKCDENLHCNGMEEEDEL